MIICMIGATEIILICAVILLIFGGKKLPEFMKGMGKGVKSFKEGLVEPSEEEMNLLLNSAIHFFLGRTGRAFRGRNESPR